MKNNATYPVLMQQIEFTIAAVDNSANQFTGIWSTGGGPSVPNWSSGPSTCINSLTPSAACVANAAATAFTNANFGPQVTLYWLITGCTDAGSSALPNDVNKALWLANGGSQTLSQVRRPAPFLFFYLASLYLFRAP